jgi:putative hemolysin
MLIESIILIILLILSAIFSGAETAFVSVTMVKARMLVDQKKPAAKLLYKLKEDSRKVIITILIGNNLVNVGASAYAAVYLTRLFGDVGIGIATGVMTLLILTFGEIIPKTYSVKHSASIALSLSLPLYILQIIFYPIIIIFEGITTLFFKSPQRAIVSEKELKVMIDIGTEEELIDKKQREMLQSVFKLDDLKAKDIMTHRIEIFALSEDTLAIEILKKARNAGYSRIPIYRETIDTITGYVHIIDLLNVTPKTTLKEISNKIPFISGEKIIQEVFVEFQKTRGHIAVVVDEFGGTAGIITMENVLEEVVGDIKDENDKDRLYIKQIDSKNFLVSGDATIADINEQAHTKLPEREHYSTISGYIQDRLKDLPGPKQTIYSKNKKIRFRIEKMSGQKVTLVKMTKKNR